MFCTRCGNELEDGAILEAGDVCCSQCGKRVGIEDMPLSNLLRENELDQYCEMFEKNNIENLVIAIELTDNDLKNMGVNILGDRIKLLKLFSDNFPFSDKFPIVKKNTWLKVVIVILLISVIYLIYREVSDKSNNSSSSESSNSRTANYAADDLAEILQDLAVQTACIGRYSTAQTGKHVTSRYDDPPDYYDPPMMANRFAAMSGNRSRINTFYGLCFDYAQFAYDDITKYQKSYNVAGMKGIEWYIAVANVDDPNTIILYDPVSRDKATIVSNGVYLKEKSRYKVRTHDDATGHAWLWVQHTNGTWYWIDPTWTDNTGYPWWGKVEEGIEVRYDPNPDYCVSSNYPSPDPAPSIADNSSSSYTNGIFNWPVRGRLISYYGYRRDPGRCSETSDSEGRFFHDGLDIAADTGTPIRAAMEGRVQSVGYDYVYGNFVVVNHPGGYRALYAYMNSYTTQAGASVDAGTIIGYVGNESFLHFTVYKDGASINPRAVLP